MSCGEPKFCNNCRNFHETPIKDVKETMKVKVSATGQEPYEIEISNKPVDVPSMMYESGFKAGLKACEELYNKRIERLIASIKIAYKHEEDPTNLVKVFHHPYVLGLEEALNIITNKESTNENQKS